MREYRRLLFFAIGQVLKFYGTLTFYYGSQWENPKMCGIWKMAGGGMKVMKIWDSGVLL